MPKNESAQDNRANQLNPTHAAYYRSRGASESEAHEAASRAKAAVDNRANQLNPNDEAYRSSRNDKKD